MTRILTILILAEQVCVTSGLISPLTFCCCGTFLRILVQQNVEQWLLVSAHNWGSIKDFPGDEWVHKDLDHGVLHFEIRVMR